MALLNPVPKATISQYFDGAHPAEPAFYHQNYRGVPLAAFKWSFPGHDGYSAHYHGAIDFAAPTGTPILASERCKVVQFGTDRYSAGAKYVFLQIRPGTRLEHWHLNAFRAGLFVGQIIPRGGIVAYVGQTGWATGPHDHCVLKITEKDPDGVTRQYLYNPVRFMVGGDLANDARVKPYY